jgi:cysteinyl-tRNA synthetase
MTLRLYNTLTRTKEDFTPIDPNNVRMYVCGPTVYDFAHIGNARPVIVFDVLFRLLRHLYGADHVKYVRNITDVDDKINARALRDFKEQIDTHEMSLNEAIRSVTQKTADQFQSDAKALGCLSPTQEPRATDNIEGMISIIQMLLDKKVAYVAQGEEGREALFDVRMMKDYGALSRRSLQDQKAGARVAVEKHKRNPEDFVLWKESQISEPGWPAEFKISEENKNELRVNSDLLTIFGRPGWHIECSAMSKRYLGEVFDIHGGGLDLIFPHHENEIAQSRCAHGSDVMANVWMHNGFLQVEGQKMSKSLGNFVTISELLYSEKFGGRTWHGTILRLAMLMTHYREPIDFSLRKLDEAENILRKWNYVQHVDPPDFALVPKSIIDALFDDLSFSSVLEYIHKLSEPSVLAKDENARILKAILGFLGLQQTNEYVMRDAPNYDEISRARIVDLINDRLVARHTKNWKESDRIRDELDAMGIAIKDNKDGTTTWDVKR